MCTLLIYTRVFRKNLEHLEFHKRLLAGERGRTNILSSLNNLSLPTLLVGVYCKFLPTRGSKLIAKVNRIEIKIAVLYATTR